MSFCLHTWLDSRRSAFEAVLEREFAAGMGRTWPVAFAEPLGYPLFTGGKRMRPLLSVAAYEAVTDRDDAEVAHLAGLAVELVHTYSLVHDDLPCMDDDDERRGRPTVHRAFSEPIAVLVGDSLLTEAFGVLGRLPTSDATRVALVVELARAAGHAGMVGGQAADIGVGGPVEDLDALLGLHRRKTGALIAAATVFGGHVAGASPAQIEALGVCGRAIGLAFQLADDVLDADEDAGSDGPPSYVKLLGIDETRSRAQALAAEAVEAASSLPAPAALCALARYAVDRQH
jgi:geranylgeranyl pyrophosphate synthase